MKNEGIEEIRNNFYKSPWYRVPPKYTHEPVPRSLQKEEEEEEEEANNNKFEKNADDIQEEFWFRLNSDEYGFIGGRIYDEVKYYT